MRHTWESVASEMSARARRHGKSEHRATSSEAMARMLRCTAVGGSSCWVTVAVDSTAIWTANVAAQNARRIA